MSASIEVADVERVTVKGFVCDKKTTKKTRVHGNKEHNFVMAEAIFVSLPLPAEGGMR